ncbi:hypothetical protein MMC13_001430 [Lambiella insularis]|nr:hypothetical protein [Lambiella insularis]
MADTKHISEDGLPSCPVDLPPRSPQKTSPHLSSPPSTPSSPCSNLAGSPPRTCSSSSVEEALATLSIGESEDARMFRSLAAIFRSAQEQEGTLRLSAIGSEVVWTSLQRADVSDRNGIQDTAALRATRDVLEQMLWNQSQMLVDASQVLADASRSGEQLPLVLVIVSSKCVNSSAEVWRAPLGDAGILNFFLGIIGTGTASDQLLTNALRLIGNTCGDNDANRQRVVLDNNLRFVIKQLDNPQLLSIVVPVLYNICSDFEPAQTLALADGLYLRLVEILEIGILASSPSFSYLCRLLDMFDGNFDPSDSPGTTVEVLLQAAGAANLDVDDQVSLVDAAIEHLKLEWFQRHMIEFDLVGAPLNLLVQWHLPQRHPLTLEATPTELLIPPLRTAEEEEQLFLMRSNIIQAMSDISALPEFASKYSSLDSSLVERLFRWLSGTNPQHQLCSCIMLGNLARSDAVCQAMISNFALHEKLLSILKVSSDTKVLHSILGFLRNLGLLPQNKQFLGSAGTIEAVARLWTTDTVPQSSQAAASLVRQLINGNMFNISRLLAPLSLDRESPAYTKTYLSLLLSLFKKSDDITVRSEIARVIAAIFRCLHSSESASDSTTRDALFHRLFSLHQNLCQPLSMMVTQSRWPIIRSEGWFAMALAARTPEGSAALDTALQQVEVFGALEATIRGQSNLLATQPGASVGSPDSQGEGLSAEREAEMRAKDRENAMVLVNELLRNGVRLQFPSLYHFHPQDILDGIDIQWFMN